MNSRERFLATMQFTRPDRIPRFEEGIREEVCKSWEIQGLPKNVDLAEFFGYDLREEIEFDLEPRPYPRQWPKNNADLHAFRKRFQFLPERFPANWQERKRDWQSRRIPLILRVQRGFFLSMGVEDWRRFHETIILTKDSPEFVAELLRLQGELSAQLTDKFLSQVSVDAALFSEPIGGDHGPLISPNMYAELVLSNYRLVLDVLQSHNVPIIIVRTYANPRPLLPLFVQAGFNCLWAVEAPPEAVNYRQIRSEFGKKLRLIGGIDTDALRQGKSAIQHEIELAAPLAAEGGYIPLLDGRVRDDVHYENYCYYRELLEKIMS